jgi:hypothetical protein
MYRHRQEDVWADFFEFVFVPMSSPPASIPSSSGESGGGSAMVIKSSIETFFQTFFAVLKDQFNNQTVAGSIALGGAALITSVGWKFFSFIRSEILKRLFTIYIIPKNTPQYQYLISWLKTQSKTSTNVMEVLFGQTSGPIMGSPFGGGGFGGNNMMSKASQKDGEKEEKEDLAIVPGLGASLFLQYAGSYLWISTGKSSISDMEEMFPFNRSQVAAPTKTVDSFPSITTFGPKNDLIRKILKEGRKIEIENSNKFTTIYATTVDFSYGNSLNWRVVAHRPARKLESIILPGDQASSLANDCKEFIQSEQWYTDRGIPYRRGYLLHGKPGCGKTSLVTAIAGSLKLNVYILSLASPGLNDNNLLELLNSIPPHTILLMEDIDAVFKTALTESKGDDSTDKPDNKSSNNGNGNDDSNSNDQGNKGSGFNFNGGGFGGFNQGGGGRGDFGFNKNNNDNDRTLTNQSTRLTFAGILNALDGIAAQTGRLLFMTTNYKDRLDPALIRPGRIDYQLYFEEATCDQIRLLFINFYRAIILLNAGIDVNDVIPVDESSEKYQMAMKEVEKLASEFSNQIPDKVYTMSQIQGVFMMYRQDPQQAVNKVQDELLHLDTSVLPPIPSLSMQMSSTMQSQSQRTGAVGDLTEATATATGGEPAPRFGSSASRFGS